jgi:hypothetical protein
MTLEPKVGAIDVRKFLELIVGTYRHAEDPEAFLHFIGLVSLFILEELESPACITETIQ